MHTLGELRKITANLPDETLVYYQRIEDVYFDKYGWVDDSPMYVYEHMPNRDPEYSQAIRAHWTHTTEIDGKTAIVIEAHY